MRKCCKCCRRYNRNKITKANNDRRSAVNSAIPNGCESQSIEVNKKLGFWKKVGLIILNKESKTGEITASLLAEILAYIFNAIAIIGVAVVFIGIYAAVKLDWSGSLLECAVKLFEVILLLGVIAVVSLIFRAVANDIKAEKDRNYITTLFFGFTSLASLIVALVALFKEVG